MKLKMSFVCPLKVRSDAGFAAFIEVTVLLSPLCPCPHVAACILCLISRHIVHALCNVHTISFLHM